MRVRWSRRALVVSGLIFGLYVMVANLLAAGAPGRSGPSAALAAIDLASAGSLFVGSLALGHHLLRRAGRTGDGSYALLGALSATPAFLAVVDAALLRRFAEDGMLVVGLLRPAVVGGLAGYLHRRSAGVEADGDDPHASPATGRAGPMRVRLSVGAVCAAALCGALLQLVILLVGAALGHAPAVMLAQSLPATPNAATASVTGFIVFGLPALLVVGAGAIAIHCSGRTGRWTAAVIGLAIPKVAGLLVSAAFDQPLAAALGSMLALPSVVAMSVYRDLAGLEPTRSPDAVRRARRPASKRPGTSPAPAP